MDHTIAAIATAPGEGGIGIIRISGHDSLNILKKVFRHPSGNPLLKDPEPRKMIYGKIVEIPAKEREDADAVRIGKAEGAAEGAKIAEDAFSVIDECLAVYMKAPRTYTGEDLVEIQCHGSIISLRKILALVLRCGASLAERGEFTKRAFLNGRMDLSQAEAVIDVIRARSENGYDSAVAQLQGALSVRIRGIRTRMADLISDIVAHIEYPEEDLEELTYEEIIGKIDLIFGDIKELYDTADTGRMLRDGLKVAIIGRPNVGKSSLMNAVLKEDRAIVTDIPGTTRDTIEEAASIGGIPVRIVDTAGIRETEDLIERMGIEKSRESLKQADLVLILVDGSSGLTSEDRAIIASARDKKCIFIVNKTDLGCKVDAAQLLGPAEPASGEQRVIFLSALSGEGISELISEIRQMVYNGETAAENSLLISNVRHEELLRRALSLLEDARGMLENGEALDFAESDIREAWMTLGEITGEAVSDDIVTEVFSRFCLGK